MTKTSNIEKFIKGAYQSNFPEDTRYMTEAACSDIVSRLRDSGLKADTDEISRAVFDYAGRVPGKAPSAHQLITEIKAMRQRGRSREQSETVSGSRTASNFIKALREESDPAARWSMICHADQDQLPVGETEDGRTIWQRNHARLYVNPGIDPCEKARQLADRHGIEYERYVPPEWEATAYKDPSTPLRPHRSAPDGIERSDPHQEAGGCQDGSQAQETPFAEGC